MVGSSGDVKRGGLRKVGLVRDPREDLPWSDQIAAWNRLLHSAGRQGSANLQLEFGIWNMLLYRVFRLA